MGVRVLGSVEITLADTVDVSRGDIELPVLVHTVGRTKCRPDAVRVRNQSRTVAGIRDRGAVIGNAAADRPLRRDIEVIAEGEEPGVAPLHRHVSLAVGETARIDDQVVEAAPVSPPDGARESHLRGVLPNEREIRVRGSVHLGAAIQRHGTRLGNAHDVSERQIRLTHGRDHARSLSTARIQFCVLSSGNDGLLASGIRRELHRAVSLMRDGGAVAETHAEVIGGRPHTADIPAVAPVIRVKTRVHVLAEEVTLHGHRGVNVLS